ncbi:MAG: TetR/AcrR family transcriptional regulator [Candidatus Cloacimonetes bacterium]|nr:TetR/AcrR family transcriptional regulator [Candidatus Cloacimonadota bacterium]
MKKNKQQLKKQIQKRSAIIDAAIKTFSLKGFHQTKISEIAKHAEVADGTVYLYFKNKDELLMVAFDEIINEKLNIIKSKIDTDTTSLRKLLHFFKLHVKLFTEEPHLARFLSIELRQSSEFYQKYPEFKPLEKYTNFLEKLCQDTIQEGNIKPFDTKALAIIFYGTMDFLLLEWATGNQNFSLSKMEKKIVDILTNGLRIYSS